MLTIRVDGSKLFAKIAAINRARKDARRMTVIASAKAVAGYAIAGAKKHEDTHRYHRGLAQAINATGVASFGVPSVQPSRLAEEFKKILQDQVRYWSGIVSGYERQGRTHDKWYRQAVRRRDASQRELSRFTPESIVMNAYAWQQGAESKRLTTVRAQIYGGTGQIYTIDDATFVRLHNKEPHASIVEYRYNVMRAAMNAARRNGSVVRAFRRNYVAELQAASRGTA